MNKKILKKGLTNTGKCAIIIMERGDTQNSKYIIKEVHKMLEKKIQELQERIFKIEMAYDRIYGQPIEAYYRELCGELAKARAELKKEGK